MSPPSLTEVPFFEHFELPSKMNFEVTLLLNNPGSASRHPSFSCYPRKLLHDREL
jgi:hypothetical protein